MQHDLIVMAASNDLTARYAEDRLLRCSRCGAEVLQPGDAEWVRVRTVGGIIREFSIYDDAAWTCAE